ncbi:MAG: hypothetical protein DMF69_09880 [Acidobacteria bacterium]|nr:MAG: hypothetical protein DMF69_09880 [Acidobacteriota bacterium]
MRQRFSIAEICLWLFVIVLGIEIGAGLYETLVVLPLWTLAPPDSVVAYHQHNISYPQFALNAGGRFWMFCTPLTGLMSIAVLLSGFRTTTEHRKWRITAAVLALVVVISTFAWFVPNIIILGRGGAGLNGEQIASLTNWWVRLNWVRVVFYLTAWLAGLRAMRK